MSRETMRGGRALAGRLRELVDALERLAGEVRERVARAVGAAAAGIAEEVVRRALRRAEPPADDPPRRHANEWDGWGGGPWPGEDPWGEGPDWLAAPRPASGRSGRWWPALAAAARGLAGWLAGRWLRRPLARAAGRAAAALAGLR